jgi:UDP-2,3-diacylglucosamine pyrophosphatase LpxH
MWGQMQIVEHEIRVKSRADEIKIHPIGDTHIGKINCDEKALRRYVQEIADDPNAYWIGGGDYFDSIKPSDIKRFDLGVLPDWVLIGSPEEIKKNLSGLVNRQLDRFCVIMQPIAHKCLGFIEGNHEFEIRKRHNEDYVERMAKQFGTVNLTDSAFMRIKMYRSAKVSAESTVVLYIEHGCGGGRSYGSELNHLGSMVSDKDADMICRGHSHKSDELATSRMHISSHGKIPKDACQSRDICALNWGSWLLSYQVGPSTYERRASYRATPRITRYFRIKPFQYVSKSVTRPRITVEKWLM